MKSNEGEAWSYDEDLGVEKKIYKSEEKKAKDKQDHQNKSDNRDQHNPKKEGPRSGKTISFAK